MDKQPGKKSISSRVIMALDRLWISGDGREPGGLDQWRERLLGLLYLVTLIAGLAALIPIVIFLIKLEAWPLIGLDLAVVVWALLVVIAGQRLSYPVRAGGALVSLLTISIAVLVFVGPLSGGPIWLFTFGVFSGLLFGLRGVVAALVIDAAVLAVLGELIAAGQLAWAGQLPRVGSSWFLMSVNFLLLNTVVGAWTVLMAHGLEKSLTEAWTARRSLEAETAELEASNERLKRETEDRRLAEDKLAEAHQRFEAVMNNLDAAVYVSDMDTNKLLFVNRRIQERLGGELEGQICWQVLQENKSGPCEFCANSRLLDDQGRPTGPYQWEYYHPQRKIWYSIQDQAIEWLDGRMVRLEVALDITDRKAMEQELQAREHRYQATFERTGTAMVVVDKNNVLTMVNDRFAELIGSSRQEIEGRAKWTEFISSDHLARMEAYNRRRKQGEAAPHEYEFDLIDRNGDRRRMIINVGLIPGSSNTIASLLDITERRRTEQALKESEAKFATAFKSTPAAISISRTDTGRYIDVNQAFTKMYGWTAEEAQGRTGCELNIWNEDYERERTRAEILERDGSVRNFEFTFRRQDGRTGIALNSAEVITIGGRPHTLSISRDVTEQKEVYEALRQSENKYRILFSTISDFVYTHDLEGRFLTVNPAVSDTLGYPVEEIIGRSVADFLRDQDKSGFADELKPLIESGRGQGILAMVGRNGSEHYVEYRSRVIEEGGERYISGSGRDITDRVLAEREVRRMEEQLTQSQKMEAIGVLASGIAHDFNNMLQTISGNTQLMLDRSRLGRDERKRINQIDQTVDRAALLVKRLLSFSRKTETGLEPLDLNGEIRHAVAMLEHTIPKMIDINLDLDSRPMVVNADSSQIEQVLLNLATNARDAMPRGGRLTVSTRRTGVTEDTHDPAGLEPGEYVVWEVADTGAGMDPDTAGRIFEPFFTTKPLGEGTGLGLFTVYGVVRSHAGHIACHSRPGRGTSFVIYLPALTEWDGQPLPTGTPDQDWPSGRETILLVDDEPEIIAPASEYLIGCGFTVLTASSGEEALEMVKGGEKKPDLVVLDLGMPGMGGERCLELLKDLAPKLPVLIASGYSDSDQIRQVRAKGAADFVAKPYRLSRLALAIRRSLDA